MNDAFRAKLDSQLDAFRTWAQGRDLRSGRLVQYLGVEMQGAIDISMGAVERQIEGLICEGIRVDWAQHGQRVYLRAWDCRGPEPAWPSVFAEEHLTDIDRILRDAGI
jgi:hypothetical protein